MKKSRFLSIFAGLYFITVNANGSSDTFKSDPVVNKTLGLSNSYENTPLLIVGNQATTTNVQTAIDIPIVETKAIKKFLIFDDNFLYISGRIAKPLAYAFSGLTVSLTAISASGKLPAEVHDGIFYTSLVTGVLASALAGWYKYTVTALPEIQQELSQQNQSARSS